MMLGAEDPQVVEVFVTWGGATLVFFGIVTGLWGFAVFLGKRMDRRVAAIAAQVDERTKQIQPHANGGNSLTDVSGRMNLLMQRQVEIGHEVSALRVSNDLTHDQLGHKVTDMSERLNEHAASPAHNRRWDDSRDTP